MWTPGWIEEKVSAAGGLHGFLEVVSKLHLASDSCVTALFKMLTYSLYAALFRLVRHSPTIVEGRRRIGLRLALEPNLKFLNHFYLDDEDSAQKNRRLTKIIGVRHEKDVCFIADFAGIFSAGRR